MSVLIKETDLPQELTPEAAVEAAYASELAEVTSKVQRGLPALIECDKDLAPYLYLNLRNRHPFQTLVLIAGFLFLLVSFHRYMLFIIAMSYMFSGIFTRLSYFFRRRPPEPKPAYNEAPEPR